MAGALPGSLSLKRVGLFPLPFSPWGEGHSGKGVVNERAKGLRKQLTDAERRLWYLLRGRRFKGWKFRRQHPVGPYVADFACLECRLIIEVDGGQHVQNQAADESRSALLRDQGFTVLRFWNNDVLNDTERVLEAILRALE